jgi:hypothetical protein
MKPILQNLVEMTGHRDHLRLEVSVLSTLQAFSGMVQVRSLEVFMLGGEQYCSPRTWMDGNGQLAQRGHGSRSPTPSRVRVADMPALHECLASPCERRPWPSWARGATPCGCRSGCTTRCSTCLE